jgi:hypothetical protein
VLDPKDTEVVKTSLSANDVPPIGESLEESPEALRAVATAIPFGKRQIQGLTKAEADGFAAALED